MNEFLPRTGPVASVVSATERGPVVRALSASEAARGRTEAEAPFQPNVTDRSAAAADYARIQANIADVLARIEPSPAKAGMTADAAEQAIVALMPNPVIMLPMPPTEPQMVAFVAQVAQSVARQAAQTRAAQANATPILIEAAAN